MQDLWNACMQALQQKTSPELFNTWTRPLKFHAFTDGVLYIGIPSRVFAEEMVKALREPFEQAIYETFGKSTRVQWKLEVDEDPNANAGKASLPRPATRTVPDAPNAAQPMAPKAEAMQSFLNEEYTFDRFCKGESNAHALNIALSIAGRLDGQTFNPFFLYGPSGVGKTHLVTAIGLEIKQHHPDKRVLFVAAATFRTQYTDAVRMNKVNDFVHFYQTIDVLIIDDFQEIKTEKTHHVFFHIFNHLQSLKRKIIITCDRPPSQFEGIEERLLTRLKWGITIDIQRPDLQLRRDILHDKLRRENIVSFPEEVIQYIAENVSDSVRELQGMVNSMLAFSMGYNGACSIDIELAKRIIPRLVNQARKVLNMDTILNFVCDRRELKPADIRSKSRKAPIASARHLICYLTHKYTDTSLSQIGRNLGGRDHSTVLHSCTSLEKQMATNKVFRAEIEALETELSQL